MPKRDILLPLRKIYRFGFRQYCNFLEQKRIFRKWKEVVFPVGRKVYLIGTPLHENMGDSAIVLAQMQFLKNCGWEESRIIEISWDEYERDRQLLDRWISRRHLIAQLGGGHMGNQWLNEEMLHRRLVTVFSQNPSVIFPQTIHYSGDDVGRAEALASVEVYDGKKQLTLVAREKKSYGIMQELYPNTKILLTPDIVLSANMDTFGAQAQKRSGVLLCLRNDPERALDAKAHEGILQMLQREALEYRVSDMYSECYVTKENRKNYVREKMEEIASAKLMITDRLHGMIFAAITGTPCIVFGNYNHKVSGTYTWIQYLTYIRYVETLSEAEACLPELLAMKNCCYENRQLKPYFEKIAEVVRKNAYR